MAVPSNLAPSRSWQKPPGYGTGFDAVKAVAHTKVAEWLGIEAAAQAHKFACVWCESSDALHIEDDRTSVKCFSCDTTGTNVDLVMAKLGLDAIGAVHALASRFGILMDSSAPAAPRPAMPRPPRVDDGRDAERAEVYAHMLELLTLTPAARRFLATRKLDFPVTANEYGFRGIDGHSAWQDLWLRLRKRFPESRLLDALMPLKGDGPARHALPWGGKAGALLIPYHFRGLVHAVRFRRYDPRDKADRYRDLGNRSPRWPFNADALNGCAGADIWVCEGELNTFCVYGTANVRAIGLPGTGTVWQPAWTPLIRDAGCLIACYDSDKAGDKATRKLAVTLAEELGIDWVANHTAYQPPPTGLDLNDLHAAGGLHEFLA
jgi:hypothetical protein